jgi:hypothetical protein
MGGLMLWLWALLAPPVGGAAHCFVPEGPIVARAVWRGQEVVAREGALEVDGRRLTACDGLPDPFPTALAVSGERLFVGFRAAGVFVFENKHFTRIEGLPADGVLALAVQGDTLWIGLGTRGLWSARGGRARAARRPLDSVQPAAVARSCRHSLCARAFKHGVLSAQGITALRADGDRLHVGVGPWGWWVIEGGRATRQSRGIYVGCFDDEGRPQAPGPRCTHAPADPASGLPSGHITAVIEHEKSLYVGTFDAGLVRLEGEGGAPGGWRSQSKGGEAFVPLEGSPRFINALLSWGHTLWIATPKGLFRLDRGGVVRPMPLALPSLHINALAAGPDGTLWMATSQGLAGLGPQGLRVLDRRHGLPGRIAYAVAVAEDGAVWAGTEGGAVRFGPTGPTVFEHARGTLTHDWVNALLVDKTSVIAGTYDAGVLRLHPDGTATPVPGLAGAWINPAGLVRVGGRLAAATLGDGLLWLGAGEGVATRQPGLPSADVTSAAWFAGRVWVGTRGGLVSYGPARPHVASDFWAVMP